jgi:ubiquitin carboxyl-terminal hydrolase 34
VIWKHLVKVFTDCISTIGCDLLRKHLFPDLSDPRDDNDVIVQRIPLLNSITRHTIADTIFFLVKDDRDQYGKILNYLSDLVPYDDSIEEGISYSVTPEMNCVKQP